MVDSDGDSMNARLETVAGTLSALKTGVEEQFKQVDQQFKRVDEQFKQVDRQFKQMRELFELQDERIRAEGEKTRRHVDILWEQMKAERNLVLDLGLASRDEVATLQASNADEHSVFEKTLADHKARLTRLEPLE
jgi:hypothetical protein